MLDKNIKPFLFIGFYHRIELKEDVLYLFCKFISFDQVNLRQTGIWQAIIKLLNFIQDFTVCRMQIFIFHLKFELGKFTVLSVGNMEIRLKGILKMRFSKNVLMFTLCNVNLWMYALYFPRNTHFTNKTMHEIPEYMYLAR